MNTMHDSVGASRRNVIIMRVFTVDHVQEERLKSAHFATRKAEITARRAAMEGATRVN